MAYALAPDPPVRLEPPAIVAPAPREASFGRVAGRVGPGVDRILVFVNGRKAAEERLDGTHFDLQVSLPPRDSTVRVVVGDPLGHRTARTVGPVFGLPQAASGVALSSYEDARLAGRVMELVERFPGTSGVYVENLTTGAGAAWNAKARFPAASTLKLGIAIEVLRVVRARPPPNSPLGRLLELMLVYSDNVAANELLAWLGGSETDGAAAVNETMQQLGVNDSYMYGGYLVASAAGPPIPLTVESQPEFPGKYTTAYDLAQLHRLVHLAAEGHGPLADGLDGSFTPSDARFLLYVLVHSADHGKLDRFLPGSAIVAHKAGWISEARHDSGLVYTREGAFVASVMTWTGGGAGLDSDVLAGRIARAALERFRPQSRGGTFVTSDLLSS